MGGGGGGGRAGAGFLVKVFKVFSLDRVQQRFVDQILSDVDVLVILLAVFQQSKVFLWMVPQIQFIDTLTSCCAAETFTLSANCAEDRGVSTGAGLWLLTSLWSAVRGQAHDNR